VTTLTGSAGSFELVSVNTSGTGTGDGWSLNQAISDDGRYVAFESAAGDLHPLDIDSTEDIYLRDLSTGTTTLVSINSSGTASGNDASSDPSMSSDGRYIAFVSAATDLVGTPVSGLNVYLYDRESGSIELVSVNDAGTSSGNGDSNEPVLAADGRSLVFMSTATDLTTLADGNSSKDVFHRDLNTATTTLISHDSSGTAAADDASNGALLSADGSRVAFLSLATNLLAVPVPQSEGGARHSKLSGQVYLHTLATGVTELISWNSTGTGPAESNSTGLWLNQDASLVLFRSYASDIVANDNNGTYDLFLRRVQLGVTEAISVNSAGDGTGNGSSVNSGSLDVSVSPDGSLVAFDSNASDLHPEDTDTLSDVFVRNTVTGTTILVSTSFDGIGSGNDGSIDPVLSSDGQWLCYKSAATNLVTEADTNGTNDLFFFALGGNRRNRLLTRGSNNNSRITVIGATVPVVAFTSRATNLAPGMTDTNETHDLFVTNVLVPVFSDGFESGDTMAWSTTVGGQ
jgi:Tol biopolymer transport system component